MKKVFKKILSIALASSVILACFAVSAFATTTVGVSYSTHVQNIGWQSAVADGATAGTTGQSLRVEALKINLTNAPAGATIAYQTHVQDKGWVTPASKDGAVAGSVGESKRIEAIAIALGGMPGYSVQYRVHVQNIGWTSWGKDGSIVGTTGKGLRIEAIEIKIVAPAALAVASVTSANATEVKVVFNKPVDKYTISAADFTFATLDGNAVSFTGSLSSDGLTYTLSTVDGAGIFKGRYDVTVNAGAITATTGEGIAKYSSTLTFADKTAPAIASVTASPSGANTSVAIKFTEPVAVGGLLTVNGAAYNPSTFSADDMTVTFITSGLTAGTVYPAQLVGAMDYADNIAGALSLTVTSVVDVTKPTVVITAKSATITLTFSEALAAVPTLTVNGTAIVPTLDSTSNGLVYTADTTGILTGLGTTFLNNANVVVSAFADPAGNAGTTTSGSFNLTTDTTAPVLVSEQLINNQLILKFDEAVAGTAGAAVAAVPAGLKLSFVDADGVVTPLTAAAWSAVKGKDLNSNGTIDTATDEVTYVVVSFTDTAAQIIKSGNLVAGTYTFSWAKGVFTDAAMNQVAAASFTLTPTTSTSTNAIFTYSAAPTANTKILVTYSEAMSASALVVANYTLGGLALPAGTTAVFYADKLHVQLTLPAGSITASGYRVLAATGVTSAVGNTISASQPTVIIPITESVKPTLTSVAIESSTVAVATFSETLANVAVTGVTVKVGGVAITPTYTISGSTVRITTTGLTAASVVTLSFSSATVQDVNGNTVADT